MNARECVDWGMGSLGLCTLGATPRVAALSLREALRLREALSLTKPWSGWVECPKHPQREETRARAALREVAWPFDGRAAVRRPTHQTSVESPSRGRRYGSGSRWGGVVP